MPEPDQDPDYRFAGEPEDFPEDWTEAGPGGVRRLRPDKRNLAPRRIFVHSSGLIQEGGRSALFLPGKFKFCPNCKDQPPGQAREINKLAGLSAEGRSSATTLLVSSALRWMNQVTSRIPADKRKLLGFTDNRQDAATYQNSAAPNNAQTPNAKTAPAGCQALPVKPPRFHIPRKVQAAINKQVGKVADKTGIELDPNTPEEVLKDAQGNPCPKTPKPANR